MNWLKIEWQDQVATFVPSPSIAPTTLDNQVLNKLREEIGQGFVRMVNFYLEDSPVQIEQIGFALLAANLVQVRKLAHGLKGASRNLGAEKLAAIARRLEETASQGHVKDGDILLRQLREEYQLIEQLLRREIADEAAEASSLAQQVYRILIADDDRTMRFALQDILEKDGYIIDLAGTGQQAVTICKRQMADLILMDAVMPEMDGFEACKTIRSLPHGTEVPILMITALENEHSVELAFSIGANDFIPKPTTVRFNNQINSIGYTRQSALDCTERPVKPD